MRITDEAATLWTPKGVQPFAPNGMSDLKASAEVSEAVGDSFSGHLIEVRPPLGRFRTERLSKLGATVVHRRYNEDDPATIVLIDEDHYGNFVKPQDYSQKAIAQAVLRVAYNINEDSKQVIK